MCLVQSQALCVGTALRVRLPIVDIALDIGTCPTSHSRDVTSNCCVMTKGDHFNSASKANTESSETWKPSTEPSNARASVTKIEQRVKGCRVYLGGGDVKREIEKSDATAFVAFLSHRGKGGEALEDRCRGAGVREEGALRLCGPAERRELQQSQCWDAEMKAPVAKGKSDVGSFGR